MSRASDQILEVTTWARSMHSRPTTLPLALDEARGALDADVEPSPREEPSLRSRTALARRRRGFLVARVPGPPGARGDLLSHTPNRCVSKRPRKNKAEVLTCARTRAREIPIRRCW